MKTSITAKKPSVKKAPGAVGKPSNIMGDRIPVMRAPRLRQLNTRDYGKGVKPPTYSGEAPSGDIGFGNTGLTGEF